jgi:hypothetical protein
MSLAVTQRNIHASVEILSVARFNEHVRSAIIWTTSHIYYLNQHLEERRNYVCSSFDTCNKKALFP